MRKRLSETVGWSCLERATHLLDVSMLTRFVTEITSEIYAMHRKSGYVQQSKRTERTRQDPVYADLLSSWSVTSEYGNLKESPKPLSVPYRPFVGISSGPELCGCVEKYAHVDEHYRHVWVRNASGRWIHDFTKSSINRHCTYLSLAGNASILSTISAGNISGFLLEVGSTSIDLIVPMYAVSTANHKPVRYYPNAGDNML